MGVALAALFAALVATASAYSSGESDLVTNLPGLPSGALEKSKLYAGYVTVDETAGRALFYTFVTANVDKPLAKPLVLWLNGGPGCSSVGGGFLSELGPLYPDYTAKPGQRLLPNPHSWNREANIVFLESPAFVGFSYSNTSSDKIVGDKRTAQDARKFVLGFLEKHPQYKDSPFWIAGESYGGHYVPELAQTIVSMNSESTTDPVINIKGFMAGNAWTDPPKDNYGAAKFWLDHALVSQQAFDTLNNTCDFTKIGPIMAKKGAESRKLMASRSVRLSGRSSDACDDAQTEAFNEMGNINIYEIYADMCLDNPSDRQSLRKNVAVTQMRHFAKQMAHTSFGRNLLKKLQVPTPAYDPCVDNHVAAYLNRRDVQVALHANVSGALHYPWAMCSDIVQYNRDDLLSSVVPVYESMINQGLSILVYSGDVDAIVPVTGTRLWLDELQLPIEEPWRPWIGKPSEQVGGYVTKFKGLTFATVRNAGHMVPYTQPERALNLFTRFIHGQPL